MSPFLVVAHSFKSIKLRVHLCGADTDMDTVWNGHVENIGPVSTYADTDTVTHPAPQVAISERTLQSSCLVAVVMMQWL